MSDHASTTTERTADSPETNHGTLRDDFAHEANRLELRANRLAFANLLTAAGTLVFGIAAFATEEPRWFVVAAVTLGLFAVSRLVQTRVLASRDRAEVRRDVHQRYLDRIGEGWRSFPNRGEHLIDRDHPYSLDIDLVGQDSLFQRIDVTQTVRGERTLVAWLSQASDVETIAARNVAVAELAVTLPFRQELEASALIVGAKAKLDDAPFQEFVAGPSFFAKRRWLVPIIHGLPLVTLGSLIAAIVGFVPMGISLGTLGLQTLLTFSTAAGVGQRFDLVAARRGFVEAFSHMLRVAETARVEAPALRVIVNRLSCRGKPPSTWLRHLDRWAGLADLRFQVLAHIPVNWLTLWDLHVLLRLETWNDRVGKEIAGLFEALGELEALSSLATLLSVDPAATLPQVVDEHERFSAKDLAHPLLPHATRVANNVSLAGPRSCLIVTGSNMAGKSTLLRALGLNLALAFAGGPVCASQFLAPMARLRASMRAEDDLGQGASYFHAELQKLKRVVEHADESPPIFFLLDELLRGTNAHARHIGARGVLVHLLDRGSTGLVATHDIALSRLEDERPGEVRNAHFTDVVMDGEMTFDYALRAGVVRTSNALRLLRAAGISVPDDDSIGNVPSSPS